jgi:hypothetical protein
LVQLRVGGLAIGPDAFFTSLSNSSPRMKCKTWHTWQGEQACAHQEAMESFDAAKKAVAKYRARDMNELVHIACMVLVYEGREGRSKRGYRRLVMAGEWRTTWH